MIIRILLVSIFVLVLYLFIRNRKTASIRAWKKVFIILFFLFAIFSVLLPEVSNYLANSLGVGRGADLLLYLLSVSFIAFALNQYLYNKEQERRLTRLVRKIAIVEANQRAGKPKDSKS